MNGLGLNNRSALRRLQYLLHGLVPPNLLLSQAVHAAKRCEIFHFQTSRGIRNQREAGRMRFRETEKELLAD
jgi:hypothetical protein